MPATFTAAAVDGAPFDGAQAALLCSLDQCGRVCTRAQELAVVDLAQRYLASWLTPGRFFKHVRTDYQPQALLRLREPLWQQGLLKADPVDGGCEYGLTESGIVLAKKLRQAMDAPLTPTGFREAKDQNLHEKRARRGYSAA